MCPAAIRMKKYDENAHTTAPNPLISGDALKALIKI
jgi:hypothetical protein